MEKNFYYEGTVTLRNVSDREEALDMLKKAIRDLEAPGRRSKGQNDDLKEAQELLASWG
jgi:hypothetical protein